MNNNTSDDNLEKALDDIFGNDFLEIDLEENKIPNNIDKLPNNEIKEDIESSLTDNMDTAVNNDNIPTINQNIDVTIKDSFSDENNKSEKISKSKKSSINVFTILLISLVAIIILLIVIYLPSYFKDKEYVINCSLNVSDKGYSISDEYKITYKNNKLEYLDGIYKYTVLNDEYKPQIEFVKNEKLPAIINSNGMDGFTYIYESGDDYFSVNSYLDIAKFDFNIIDKNDNKKNPLSYVNVNSKTTYKSLIKYFEKNGYKCTKSR